MTKELKKIAIVGMGIAGVSALREWTRQQAKQPEIEITAFGDAATFGRGEPYQQEDDILILNQPAGLATIVPEKPDDFVDWLKENHDETDPRYGYYPRALFGQYMHERMEVWLEKSQAETVKEKVETIDYLKNGQFRIQSATHEGIYDAVHIAIGSAPYADYYDLADHPHFILDPFPIDQQLAEIPKGVRVGVLGTGLTSIDILRYLDARRPDLHLSFYSPSGRFKTVRGETIDYEYQYFTPENIQKEQAKNNGFIPLTTYFDWFKKEVAVQGIEIEAEWFHQQAFGAKDTIQQDLEEEHKIGVIQTLILGLDRMLTEMWMSLTDADKNYFLEEYGQIWDKVRSSFPRESGEILVDRWEKDEIKVYSDLVDIVPNEDSFRWVLKNQKDQRTDYIVNAAGTDLAVSFKTERKALLRDLLNKRIIQSERFGGVQVTVPTLSAVSQKYGVIDRLKVHGPLISGIQFGNNSIDIISEGVQRSVQAIVADSQKNSKEENG